MSWLYFSTRSPRQGAPVLRWPVSSATVMSAMKLSTVSPERWETKAPHPWNWASRVAAMVSVRVPIWLSLIRAELAMSSSMPRAMMAGLVQKMSSPTSSMVAPSLRLRTFHPSQSPSARPSSRRQIG